MKTTRKTKTCIWGPALLAPLFMAMAGSAALTQAGGNQSEVKPAGLAGGASALTEVHGDWTVTCQVANNAKTCLFSQQQIDPNTRQRLLAMELATGADEAASGVLALPFGLALAAGVTMSVDDQTLGETYAFRTCVPAGCIVPLQFDATALERLKSGGALKITGTTSDTDQPIDFSLSLAGFSGALSRTATLSAD